VYAAVIVLLGEYRQCPFRGGCFRSFAVAAPTAWNSLPVHIRNSSSMFGFRRQLKTFLYKLAFDPL